MTRDLFELCGQDRNRCISPFAWRTRLALCRKGLTFRGIPAAFAEKDKMAPSGCKTFPVLRDEKTWIGDSWAIAEYLEDTYPDAPSLFGSNEGKAYALFFKQYFLKALQPRIFPLIANDIFSLLDERDKQYFYDTRSKRVGMPLEDLIPLKKKNLEPFKAALTPLREFLSEADFFSGRAPLYPDFIAFSVFKWAELSSPADLLEGEDGISTWYRRVEAWYRDNIGKYEDPPLL